jgi:hypothetical protein
VNERASKRGDGLPLQTQNNLHTRKKEKKKERKKERNSYRKTRQEQRLNLFSFQQTKGRKNAKRKEVPTGKENRQTNKQTNKQKEKENSEDLEEKRRVLSNIVCKKSE